MIRDELRPGNLILKDAIDFDAGGNKFNDVEWSEINFYHDEMTDNELNQYSAIPIPDEWLEKIKSIKYFHELQNAVKDIFIAIDLSKR